MNDLKKTKGSLEIYISSFFNPSPSLHSFLNEEVYNEIRTEYNSLGIGDAKAIFGNEEYSTLERYILLNLFFQSYASNHDYSICYERWINILMKEPLFSGIDIYSRRIINVSPSTCTGLNIFRGNIDRLFNRNKIRELYGKLLNSKQQFSGTMTKEELYFLTNNIFEKFKIFDYYMRIMFLTNFMCQEEEGSSYSVWDQKDIKGVYDSMFIILGDAIDEYDSQN